MTEQEAYELVPFDLQSRCKKHVLITDLHWSLDVLPELHRMSVSGHPVECNIVGASPEDLGGVRARSEFVHARYWPEVEGSETFREYLGEQPMGTHLYISAAWPRTRSILRVAETLGYASEDIQLRPYGSKYQQVFCISCYALNAIGDDSTVTCHQCGRELSVSNHYSRRLDAVLGHIVLKNCPRKENL